MSDIVAIQSLRPTQMTLGLREVTARSDKLRTWGRDAIKAYAANRVVPCVKGPHGHLYVIDRHHMCRALLMAGVQHAPVDVMKDASHLAMDEFPTFMDLQNWLHPFDRNGKRQDVTSLPTRIEDLVDDPYRGLAWYLRRAKGYAKTDTPFEEFIWADFLRRRIGSERLAADYDKAKCDALELAASQEASHMPGWAGGKGAIPRTHDDE